jgi:PAS domain S-box-containing protein
MKRRQGERAGKIPLEEVAEAAKHPSVETSEVTEEKKGLEKDIGLNATSEQTLRTLLDTITETVVLLDLQGRAVMVNRVAAGRLKASPAEIEGRVIFDLFPPDLSASRRKMFETVIETGRPAAAVDQREGRTYDTAWHPVFDRDGRLRYVSVFATDITALKRAEEGRISTEKLESIGLLAGGIAHDFNNLLTGIMGFVDLSRTSSEPGSRQYKFLSEAMNLCHKAKDLTRRFTTFAKGGDPIMRPMNLSALVRDTVALVLSGSNIEAEIVLAPDLKEVDGDETQMRDVLASIITNAMEAMPKGGRIEIRVENTEQPPPDPPAGPSVETRLWVHIAIKDFGVGIPKENLPKLFLPYFSTKQRGAQKGMGLSLPTAYAIMRRHGGAIHVESEAGKGTTVHLYLPATSRPYYKRLEEKKTPAEGHDRILLMDDDETVLEVASSILERGGFEVTACRNGREAISLFRKALEEGRPFIGVILDLTIRGGMGGRDVVKELIQLDPEVKALVSSGYSEDPVMSNYSAFGFCGAVSKPYDIRVLLRAANRAFRSRDAKKGRQGLSPSGGDGN